MLSPHLTHYFQPFVISTFISQTNSKTEFYSAFHKHIYTGKFAAIANISGFPFNFAWTQFLFHFCFQISLSIGELLSFFLAIWFHNISIDSTFIVFFFRNIQQNFVWQCFVCDFWLCCFNGWRHRFHSIQWKVFMYFFFFWVHNLTWFCSAHVPKISREDRKGSASYPFGRR